MLVETDGPTSALALFERLARDPLPDQVDVVPGARSVLVRFAGPVDCAQIGRAIRSLPATRSARPTGPESVIEAVYDGPDLDEVGRLTGLGAAGVVTAHTRIPWRVSFCGFSPGFAYLTGGDPRIAVPRLDRPREQVPAGSVGLAGEYSGVYPSVSPGGWQLIGRTGAVLWDVLRDPPALLRPGMSVRFRAVREVLTAGRSAVNPPAPGPHPTVVREVRQIGREPVHFAPLSALPEPPVGAQGPALIVARAGLLCVVQDLGRTGMATMGVSPSGPADRGAALRANRIVGNPADAAVVEILLGGAEFVAGQDLLLAITGAPVPISLTPGASQIGAAATHRPIPLPAGARIRLGRPVRGLRSYLAVRGGLSLPRVLGSCSTDLLAGIGPRRLQAGDVLPIGDHRPAGQASGTDVAAVLNDPGARSMGPAADLDSAPTIPEIIELDVLPGPQLGWFVPDVFDRIRRADWTVSPSSNRVGVRLTGPDLPRVVGGELPSQGLVRGAVQVPPSGQPLIFLADHPVTGGYPVLGVLTDASADLAGQARPGASVRLRPGRLAADAVSRALR